LGKKHDHDNAAPFNKIMERGKAPDERINENPGPGNYEPGKKPHEALKDN
jgi:hypothetical protein